MIGIRIRHFQVLASYSGSWNQSPCQFIKVARKLFKAVRNREDENALQVSYRPTNEDAHRPQLLSGAFLHSVQRRTVVRVFLCFDWQIRLNIFIKHAPSHNASYFNHMAAQVCVGIKMVDRDAPSKFTRRHSFILFLKHPKLVQAKSAFLFFLPGHIGNIFE